MIAPKDESSDLVMQWIESEGLGDSAIFSPRLDSVVVEASISKIEKLLNAEYTPFGKRVGLSIARTQLILVPYSTLIHRRCFSENPRV